MWNCNSYIDHHKQLINSTVCEQLLNLYFLFFHPTPPPKKGERKKKYIYVWVVLTSTIKEILLLHRQSEAAHQLHCMPTVVKFVLPISPIPSEKEKEATMSLSCLDQHNQGNTTTLPVIWGSSLNTLYARSQSTRTSSPHPHTHKPTYHTHNHQTSVSPLSCTDQRVEV